MKNLKHLTFTASGVPTTIKYSCAYHTWVHNSHEQYNVRQCEYCGYAEAEGPGGWSELF